MVDLFAGAGGNAIAFALSGRWSRVVAVERDAATLACAQHNARAAGVPPGAIAFVLGDCFAYLAAAARLADARLRLAPRDSAVVLFGSPPWGGVGYRDAGDVFDLATMEPYNLARLHEACRGYHHALYLPRTSDLRQIARLAPTGEKIEVVQYCMEGASKAMVAYVPAAKD